MNFLIITRVLKHQSGRKTSLLYLLAYLLLVTTSIAIVNNCSADEGPWQINNTFQTRFQSYIDSSSRDNAFNAGYFMTANYLDTGSIGLGYNYTLVNLNNNSDITEHLFYLSGQYHMYPDSLPGKLSLRLDTYYGEDTLKTTITTPPTTIIGPGMGNITIIPGSSTTVEETTDISAYYPQLIFINYNKTFYADIGYAHSEYDGVSTTKVDQITPSIGFGWNESYDWLQLRAYFIDLSQNTATPGDDKLESLEAKYTHWYSDETISGLEFIRFSVLLGDREFAIDPDAATIYSIVDKQNGSVSGSMQWKFSQKTKALALIQYDQYRNDALADDYDSLLFYINIQFLN